MSFLFVRYTPIIRLWVCIYLVAVVNTWCSSGAQGGNDKPNVIFIISDDNSYNDFGFARALTNQSSQFETPNLDALAAQSTVFRQGYSAAPLCSTSRAGLLMGRYQQRSGYNYNIDNGTETDGLLASDTTIAQRLKEIGYSTGAIGKWHLGIKEGVNLPTDKGFDEFFGFYGGARFYFRDDRILNTMRRGTAIVENEYRASAPQDWDPVSGRYATDAFGDEGASFIRNHANNGNPFFLYFAPNAAHVPYDAKQQDLNHFSSISDTTQRSRAAVTYAFDRAVGKLLSALDDPNGDGDTADSVRENTIIAYLNDNGGTPGNNNAPFRSTKGFTFEGGIRVPMLLSGPGIQPSQYNAPVIAQDLSATAMAAAGLNLPSTGTDGVDLMPYVSGANSSDPHDALFWRDGSNWAIRKGNMKYVRSSSSGLFNLADDPTELVDLTGQMPEIKNDLIDSFTRWEATLAKPRWPSASTPIRYNDHFVLDVYAFGGGFKFSTNAWLVAETIGTTNITTNINLYDGYANTTIDVPAKNGNSFGVANDQTRLSGLPFMLNELRFSGISTNTAVRFAQFTGLPLIFSKNLNGDGPKLRLDATSSGTSVRYQFLANTEMQLLDDLEITGDGTQEFIVTGYFKDSYAPRNIMKTGTSTVQLKGSNTFRGNLIINGGQVSVTGGTGAINGANSINIGSAGKLALDSGNITVNSIDNFNGGEFDFDGGTLKVVNYFGDLSNNGGNYSPGISPASSAVYGNYSQTAASKLTMELSGTSAGWDSDQLLVAGSASLAGTLQIDLLNGFAPQQGDIFNLIVSAGGINGTFANTIIPPLLGGLTWRLAYSPSMVELIIGPPEVSTVNPIPGDYNGNGTVDAADYVVWRKMFGQTGPELAADGTGDNIVDSGDLNFWRARFGNVTPPPPGTGSSTAVPEPSSIMTSLAAVLALLTGARSAARR